MGELTPVWKLKAAAVRAMSQDQLRCPPPSVELSVYLSIYLSIFEALCTGVPPCKNLLVGPYSSPMPRDLW